MANNYQSYQLYESQDVNSIRYFFLSEGIKTQFKVVEYGFLTSYLGLDVYNLAFGDYDKQNNCLIDNVYSNNGDHYMIFNTVLSTVPKFFKLSPASIIMVQGSDSSNQFANDCRKDCKKRCEEFCKKQHQRIRLYNSYIHREYDSLSSTFLFWGGISFEQKIILEEFNLEKYYKTIYCRLK